MGRGRGGFGGSGEKCDYSLLLCEVVRTAGRMRPRCHCHGRDTSESKALLCSRLSLPPSPSRSSLISGASYVDLTLQLLRNSFQSSLEFQAAVLFASKSPILRPHCSSVLLPFLPPSLS